MRKNILKFSEVCFVKTLNPVINDCKLYFGGSRFDFWEEADISLSHSSENITEIRSGCC
jgi:hypothetical protein